MLRFLWSLKLRYPILILIAILVPIVLSGTYERYLLVLVIIFSILILSLDIILGHMGQFSFGHQVFFGVGAYTTAILSTTLLVPVWLSFLAGIALAAVFGLCIGLISLRQARGFYLAIITLGIGQIVWLVAIKWRSLTGSTEGISFIPAISLRVPFFGTIELDTELSYYYFALALLIFVIYIVSVWSKSRFGRATSAIRENEELAKSMGINPFKYYVGAFTFASALAGLAGVMYAHFMSTIAPDSLGTYYMIWILAMVILGGRRTYAGPIIGATILVFLPQLLTDVKEYRMVIVGIILLLSILFMPQGIAPALGKLWNRIAGRLPKKGLREESPS